MTAGITKEFDRVFLQLQKRGLLLLSDSSLPSVSRLIAGDSLRGSWWTHERAHTIFAVNEMIEDHPDVLITKLISKKVTFVHRELWAEIYSIGVAREDWQLKGLTAGAKQLLKTVEAEGTLQTNDLGKAQGAKAGDTARVLETRLLLHANQIHTESGAHAKVLETWDTWAKRAAFRAKRKDPLAARRFLEQRLAELNTEFTGRGELPWLALLKP
ncbi:MAG TPA: hypothetical protein VKB02_06140 [Pyrinomonadaceae bacterium]|nr:hypothetical protein [Pyrinomonadaceae bacterium]